MNKILSSATLVAILLGCAGTASAAPQTHRPHGHGTVSPGKRGPIDPVPPPPPPDLV